MKLIQLFEQAEPNIEAIAKEVLQNCQPFLKEWGEIPTPKDSLIRGMKIKWPQYLFQTHADRYTKDLSKGNTEFFDNAFYNKFGHKFRTNHVVFTARVWVEDIEESYGPKHVVLPKGQYQYLWSPDIVDLYSTIIYGDLTNEEILEQAKWQYNTNLRHANVGHEIMINVNEYYAFPKDVYDEQLYPYLIK